MFISRIWSSKALHIEATPLIAQCSVSFKETWPQSLNHCTRSLLAFLARSAELHCSHFISNSPTNLSRSAPKLAYVGHEKCNCEPNNSLSPPTCNEATLTGESAIVCGMCSRPIAKRFVDGFLKDFVLGLSCPSYKLDIATSSAASLAALQHFAKHCVYNTFSTYIGKFQVFAVPKRDFHLRLPQYYLMAPAAARRFHQIIRLKSSSVDEYKSLHSNIPSSVADAIKAANISDYSIAYCSELGLLVARFTYHGSDWDADGKAMVENPEVRRWWAITDGMQVSACKNFREPRMSIESFPANISDFHQGELGTRGFWQCEWAMVEGDGRSVLPKLRNDQSGLVEAGESMNIVIVFRTCESTENKAAQGMRTP